MDGPSHYREAERLLAQVDDYANPNAPEVDVARAQVHAPLAVAAAAIAAAPVAESRVGGNWLEVTASRPAAGR